MSATASELLARHVAAIGAAPLAEESAAAAKTWILDTIGVGVGVAGATAEGQASLRRPPPS